MKRFATIFSFTVLFMLIVVTPASAFVWSHVGGDPLVPGGVWSSNSFSKLMVNDPATAFGNKVHQAFSYVVNTNHQPKWVLPTAYKNAASGNIHSGTVPYGSYLGAMSYGRSSVRVVPNCVYKGQYANLSIFYTVSSKTTTVKIAGKYYRQTTSYWVSMAKPCGNVFIYHKRVVKKRLWELRVEKRLDSVTGERLADWKLSGKAAGKDVTVTTKRTGSVLVGRFLPGQKFSLSEELKEGWEIVSPDGGKFTGTMPKKNLTLIFVNRRIEQKFRLLVEKRCDTVDGALLPDWVIEGSADGSDVSVTTSDDGPTLVGTFSEGAHYDLSEVLKDGWEIVSPDDGRFTGTMPAHDVILTFVNSRVPEVEKHHVYVRKLDYDTKDVLSWGFDAIVGDQNFNFITDDSGWYDLGEFVPWTHYYVTEDQVDDWIPVTPDGILSGFVEHQDVYLTFENRYSPPPPQHILRVLGSYTPLEHLDFETFSATLNAVIVEHSDNDTVTYRWDVNGVAHYTDLASYYIVLSYETVYNVTLVATDADGHQAQFTLPAFNEIGPSDPPPPPPNPVNKPMKAKY